MEKVNKRIGGKVVFVCASVVTAFGFIAGTLFKYRLAMASLGTAMGMWIFGVLIAYRAKRLWPDICITVAGAVISVGLISNEIRLYNSISIAIGRGDIARIKKLIHDGANVNAHTSGGQTMLTWAFWYPYPNKTIWKDDMPLMILTPEEKEKKVLEILKLLIDKGADVNSLDQWGYTPLHLAVAAEQVHVVTMLLKRGADVNVHDGEGRTPLKLAIENGNDKIAELLRQHGAKE